MFSAVVWFFRLSGSWVCFILCRLGPRLGLQLVSARRRLKACRYRITLRKTGGLVHLVCQRLDTYGPALEFASFFGWRD